MDRGGSRGVQGRPSADGQGHRSELEVRRPRGRLQEGGAGPRRDVRHAEHQPSVPREPHVDGVLAERQAVYPPVDAEHGADGHVGRALAGHRSRKTSSSSASTCGGGYGSKGTGSVTDIIPALLSKKTGTPVQMRISREEEHAHRRRASRHARPDEGRVHQGRPHHRARHVHGGRRRAVRPGRRRQHGQPLRVAVVSARGHALARHDRDYQHAASPRAEPARRHAGHRADGTGGRQGGTQARDRSGRDPEDQRAGRQSEVRPGGRARQPDIFDQLLRQGGA